jgi:hypothetical protein
MGGTPWLTGRNLLAAASRRKRWTRLKQKATRGGNAINYPEIRGV